MFYEKHTFCLKLTFLENLAYFGIDYNLIILFYEENSSVQGFALCVVTAEIAL
jgi:hypothetical protein